MKVYKILGAMAVMFLLSKSVLANDIYVAQSATGANSGVDCADAHSASWFNSAGSWGTGTAQIGPGTTVHLCGTFTAGVNSGLLYVQASGTAAAPIKILLESGAILQSPAFSSNGAIYNTASYIVIDGGANGIIQNTANCTTCANHQQDSSGIYNLGSNVEIRNLTCQNIYARTANTDHNMGGGPSTNNCIFSTGSNISIHDNILHDAGWTVWYAMPSGSASNFSMYNNNIYNTDHGVGFGEGSASGKTFSGVNIYNNHFHDPVNWDDGVAQGSSQCYIAGENDCDWYHHDGIHMFAICGDGTWCSQTTISNVNLYDNLFDGDWGTGISSLVFMEGLQYNLNFFNNVAVMKSGVYANNGLFNIGASTIQVFNNSTLGNYTSAGRCLVLRGQGGANLARNNVASGCLSGYMLQVESGSITNDHNVSGTLAALGLNSLGIPTSNSSIVVGAALNLSSLGITGLDSDKNGAARPTSGAWDAGAYNLAGSGSVPAAPTGLQATAK
jgi:hypothetical protein